MQEPVSALMLEFLTWVASAPRTYGEAMEAWRTACPRQSVWEDAFLDGLVRVESGDNINRCKVNLTTRGRGMLPANSRAANEVDCSPSGR